MAFHPLRPLTRTTCHMNPFFLPTALLKSAFLYHKTILSFQSNG
jgi:hypothetical protein